MLGAEKDWRCPARCPDLGRGGVWRLPEGVCGVIPVQQQSADSSRTHHKIQIDPVEGAMAMHDTQVQCRVGLVLSACSVIEVQACSGRRPMVWSLPALRDAAGGEGV